MKLERINSFQHAAWMHDPVTIELLRELDAERERFRMVSETTALNGVNLVEVKDFVMRAAILGKVRKLITEVVKPETEEGAKE